MATRARPASIYDVLAARVRDLPAAAPTASRLPRRRRARAVDVWSVLDERLDLASFRPRLAADVEIRRFRARLGGEYGMLGNLRDLVYLRLSREEMDLVDAMDGTRTIGDLIEERLESDEMQIDGIVGLVVEMQALNFFERRFVDVHAAIAAATGPGERIRRRREALRTLTVEWRGAHGFTEALYRRGARHLFHPVAIAAQVVILVAGFAAFLAMFLSGGRSIGAGVSAVGAGLIVMALSYGNILTHELGHAVTLIHYGRRIRSAGAQLYFGRPALFIDSSDGQMLPVDKRIRQAFAGVFAGSLVSGLAAIAALVIGDSTLSSILYTFAALDYFAAFLNLVPLLELDGYWILSDMLQVPDLRPRSLSFVASGLWRKLAARERLTRTEAGLALYGIAGILFTIFAFYYSFYFWKDIFGALISGLWNGGIVGRGVLAILGYVVAAPLVRGGVRLASVAARRARDLAGALRFRFERRWRVEAAELIDALPGFEQLDEESLSDLAGRARLKRVSRGQEVVTQGERGDAFYVVRRGRFLVVARDPVGREHELRTLTRGEAFGELAVANAAPRKASVRALEDSEVFWIDKGTFDRLLADAMRTPAVGAAMQDAADLRGIPCFSHLEVDELLELAGHGSWVNAAPGTRIVKQGDRGDVFYAIGSGRVEVVKDRRVVAELGPGDHFGELALLRRAPRAATVRAVTPVRAFALDAAGFDRMVRRTFRRGRSQRGAPGRPERR